MIKVGTYKTNDGHIAVVDRIGDGRAYGRKFLTPQEAEDRGYGDRCIEMDWNEHGALSDFDHRPWTPGCLNPLSWKETPPYLRLNHIVPFSDYEETIIGFMARENHLDPSAVTPQQAYDLLIEFGDREESQMHFKARG